jgi:acetate kinase
MKVRLGLIPTNGSILTINGGSSSIKFAIFQYTSSIKKVIEGSIDRIGLNGTSFTFNNLVSQQQCKSTIAADNHNSATNYLLDWLGSQEEFSSVVAVGHRIVHGMGRHLPAIVSLQLLDELTTISQYDPDHLPAEIKLIEAFLERYSSLIQVTCFDTAFHNDMPRVAKMLAIPRRYTEQGIQRYGFHGLSYAYLMETLVSIDDAAATQGKVILAHLGSGASMAAILNGKSIDTSMGFTPTSGLPMSTRSGDIDPGLLSYFQTAEKMTATQFHQMINQESGLLGISETSPNMSDLLALEKDDLRAAEAVALFCYQAKKYIGAYAAALGGLDTLVFSGGIGENSAVVRACICDDLGFLGIELATEQNDKNASLISSDKSRVNVRVIHTDEAQMIAKSIVRFLSPALNLEIS